MAFYCTNLVFVPHRRSLMARGILLALLDRSRTPFCAQRDKRDVWLLIEWRDVVDRFLHPKILYLYLRFTVYNFCVWVNIIYLKNATSKNLNAMPDVISHQMKSCFALSQPLTDGVHFSTRNVTVAVPR